MWNLNQETRRGKRTRNLQMEQLTEMGGSEGHSSLPIRAEVEHYKLSGFWQRRGYTHPWQRGGYAHPSPWICQIFIVG